MHAAAINAHVNSILRKVPEDSRNYRDNALEPPQTKQKLTSVSVFLSSDHGVVFTQKSFYPLSNAESVPSMTYKRCWQERNISHLPLKDTFYIDFIYQD